ncbi:MAG: S1 family peptidase [Terriglobales bacterium]
MDAVMGSDNEQRRQGVRSPAPWTAAGLAIAMGTVLWIAPGRPAQPDNLALELKIAQLSSEVHGLRQEQAMPVVVLNQHRDSIGYLYGEYSFRGHKRTRLSGTGFVVGNGLLATNRHVAEPWFEDPEAEMLMRRGAQPRLEKMLAFFPGMSKGLEVTGVTVSPDEDLAVARFDAQQADRELAALPLAARPGVPGDPVVVVGYPMGIAAMVAKSPRPVYRRLVQRTEDMAVASELASLSLIRPSATFGHLGDVVDEKLIYDAVTAHGGSGGPVFNARGEVIGVNTAYLDGFSGSTLGVSVTALHALVETAQQR